jgi:thiol:disulfide interchange protein
MKIKYSLSLIFVMTAIAAFFTLWQRERYLVSQLSWEPYAPENLETALNDGTVVVISLTANWDLSSQAREELFDNPEICRFVRVTNARLMRADLTQGSPAAWKLMESVNLIAAPAFLVYSPYRTQSPDVIAETPTEDRLLQAIAHAGYRGTD